MPDEFDYPEVRPGPPQATRPPSTGEFDYPEDRKDAKKAPPKSRFDEPLIHLDKYVPESKSTDTPLEQGFKGAVRGAATAASELTSPRGMVTTAGLVVGEYVPVVGPLLSRAAGTYFAYSSARNVIDSIPEAKEALNRGDWDKLGQVVGADTLNAYFGYQGSKAALRDIRRAPGEAKARTIGAGAPAAHGVRRAAEWLVGETPEQKQEAILRHTVRARRGTMDHEMGVAIESFRNDHPKIEALPKTEQWAIADDIEQAKDRDSMKQRNPAFQATAERMQTLLDDEWDKIVGNKKKGIPGLGIPGLDRHFYETYFPHMWKDPAKAEGVIRDWYQKRPLSGSEAFRKHRRSQDFTFEDGREAGLTPLTDNPIEMTLYKLKEVKKFRMAQEVKRDLFARDLLRELPLMPHEIRTPEGPKMIHDRMPADWSKIDDKSFRIGPRGIQGDLIAPTPVAKAMNAYLSPGIRHYLEQVPGVGGAASKAVGLAQWYNASSNMLNVSLSAFHGGLEMGLSFLNEISLQARYASLALTDKAARGRKLNPLWSGLAWAPVRDFFKVGAEFQGEFYHPGSNPHMAKIVEAFEKGGGRFRSEPLMEQEFQYRSNMIDKFFKRWRADASKRGTEAIPKAMQQTFDFTMQKAVPRLKAAAFARMAEFEMARLGPEASEDAVREAMGKVVDSIDNRMGQMTYDNWFIPKWMKDSAFLGTHFLGWTFGTLREGGGGALDILRQPVRKALGMPMELSHRSAWAMSLPFAFSMWNGMYNWYMTGQMPTGMDYIAPRNGRTRADGQPERDALPFTAYLREYYEWLNRGKETASGKFSNLLAGGYEVWRNTDIQGRQIYPPGAQSSGFEKIMDTMEFMIGKAAPISFQTFVQEYQGGESMQDAATRALFGVRPAAAHLSRTAAQNMILDNSPVEMKAIRTEKFERRQTARRLMENIRSKRATLDDARKAYEAKQLTPNDYKTLVRAVAIPMWSPNGVWGKRFTGLEDPVAALAIFRIATDEEKRNMEPLMPYHIARLARQGKPAEAKKLREEVDKIMHGIPKGAAPPAARANPEFDY